MSHIQEEFNEEYDNHIINEEYKIWKKNAPFMYDLVITHELDWPSLTTQWLPTKEIPSESDYSIHKLILGTNTSGQAPNYLMIAKVRLPQEDTASDVSEFKQKNNQVGGLGVASGENKLNIEIKMVHEGEVNRARYMPQKYNIIATKTVSGEVHIFDYTQHPAEPENENVSKPQLRLLGQKQEGYGLSWNPKKEGYLLSGSYDSSICLWNIESATELNSQMKPMQEFLNHKAQVEDVCWHSTNQDIFGSVGDDKRILIWDIRSKTNQPTHSVSAHQGDIYSIDFNPFNDYLFLTSSEDNTIALWDLRNTSKKIHSFLGHNDAVIRAEWSPFSIGLFASASADRRVIIWDLSKCGDKLSKEDEQDGPAEMLFVHGGHRARVNDISWNLKERLVIASVEEQNNILQIWQMAQNIYDDDDDATEIKVENPSDKKNNNQQQIQQQTQQQQPQVQQ